MGLDTISAVQGPLPLDRVSNKGAGVPGEVRAHHADAYQEGIAQKPAEQSLSERLWGFRWTDYLPKPLDNGVVVAPSTPTSAKRFMAEHFSRIFDLESRFYRPPESSAKQRYFDQVSDFHRVIVNDEQVGLGVGNAVDWSTYYIRSLGFLPELQGKQAGQGYLKLLCQVLAEVGVERIEAHAGPNNGYSAGCMMRVGFYHSGSIVSERWGALSVFTKHLKTEANDEFCRSFCATS